MRIYWHLIISALIFTIAYFLKLENGITPLVLLILADIMLDTDHLIKFKSLRRIDKQYNKCMDYPFHKVWIVVPAAVLLFFTPIFWMGIGLLIHISIDYVDNHIMFNGKFKWA